MAKITISETQARLCVEALEFSARAAQNVGQPDKAVELDDLARRLRTKLSNVDLSMREKGRRQ